MLVIMPSGSWYCYANKCGIFFWGVHAHDAVWHLALTNTAFITSPFISPLFSGAILGGYNFFMDLVIHALSFIGIPVILLYFKIVPIIWFVLLTSFTITLGRKLKDDPLFVFFLLFFVYFGASFTFLITLYHNKSIWNSSGMIAMQSSMHLTNLQFALSLVVLMAILISLKSYTFKKNNSTFILLLGFFIFVNLGLKFYAGLVSFFMVTIFFTLHYLKQGIFRIPNSILYAKYIFIIVVFSILGIIIFYNPFSSLKTGSILIFSPFATMHSIIEEPSLIYLKDMVNARYYLYAHVGLLSPRLWTIELFSSALVLVFSMGLRLFGIIYFLVNFIKRKTNIFELSIFLTIVFSYLLTTLFIQKGQWWNTVQFYYFSLFLANLFVAEFLYGFAKKNKISAIITIVLMLLLSLPTNLDVARNYLTYPAQSYLPWQEIQALEFLQKQPNGAVYIPSFKKLPNENDPQPLYKQDTAYVSAFSGHPLYFADQSVLEITGTDFKSRKEKIIKGDCSIFKDIKYIYKLSLLDDKVTTNCLTNKEYHIEEIYNKEGVVIYKVI